MHRALGKSPAEQHCRLQAAMVKVTVVGMRSPHNSCMPPEQARMIVQRCVLPQPSHTTLKSKLTELDVFCTRHAGISHSQVPWMNGVSFMVGHPLYNAEFAQLDSNIGGKSNAPSPLDKVLILKDSDGCVN